MPQFNYSLSGKDGANGPAGATSASCSAASPDHQVYVLGMLAPPTCATATVTYDNFGSVFARPRDRLSWLHEFFGDQVLGIIKRVTARQIARADLDDIYQEAFRHCLCLIEGKPLAAKDYLPLLLRIARCRGFDALRRRKRNGKTTPSGFVWFVDPRSPRPHLSSAHDDYLTPAERQELAEVLAELIAQLPPRQQSVALIYLECVHELRDHGVHQRLAEAISKLTGHQENPETIKSLWRTARERLAVGLRRRGYDWRTE